MSANSKGPARIRFCAGFSCLRHWARHHTNCVGTSRIPLFVGCGGAGLCSSDRPIGGRCEACGTRCGARGRRQGLTETGSAPPDRRSLRGLRDPLRCPWAAAGPGRASRRRAERSSQRGRRAGGPPPTGIPSRPIPTGAPRGGRRSGGVAISQKVVAPRKTWGPPLMRSLA